MIQLKNKITYFIIFLSIGIFSTNVYSDSECIDCMDNILKFLINKEEKKEHEIIDFTSGNIEENLLKMKNKSKDSFILIDNTTLSNPNALKRLQSSEARICLKMRSMNKKSVEALLKQKIEKMDIISLIPKNEVEIKNVYSGTINLSDKDLKIVTNQMVKAKKLFEEIENSEILKVPNDNSLTLAKLLENKATEKHHDNLLIIIGHNEIKNNNRVLKCSDGSTISMSKLTRLLEENNRPGLILSCETMTDLNLSGLATTKRLEFDEMALALKKCQKNLKNYDTPEMKDFINELEIAFRESESKLLRNTYIIAGVSGGSVILIYTLSIASSGK